MKKIKLYLLISFLIVCFSCKNGTTLTIHNESGKELKNVTIETGFTTIKVEQLKIGETKNVFVDFDKNTSKSDGIMRLNIKEVKDTYYEFGYFSNGVSPSEDIRIFIKKDTIEFK